MNFTDPQMFAYSPLFLWQVRQAQAAQQAQIWQIQQAQQVQQMQMQHAQIVHYNRPKRRRRGKTAASNNNQITHASRNTITNGDRIISHHDCVGDSSNARSGSQGPPPLVSPTPDLESLRRAALESRGKRSRPSLTKATRDDLPQCIVTNDGTEFDRPRKRVRFDDQPTSMATSQAGVASTSMST